MDDSLLGVVLGRLDGTDGVTEEIEALVLAALSSDADLEKALLGSSPARSKTPDLGIDPPPADSPRIYLQRITVTGFRGIGPAAELKLQPGPGLTVVCGRNGSGKSSFAEALEALFTGHLKRWDRRSAEWKESWRCIHGGQPRVTVDALVEGVKGVTVLERVWSDEHKKLEDGPTTVAPVGMPRRGIDEYGWSAGAIEYRPFLSHAELEALLDSPKSLHDQLNDLLGLDELDAASERLRSLRTRLDKTARAAKDALPGLLGELDAAGTDRATKVAGLLRQKTADLDAVEHLAVADDDTAGDARTVLRAVTGISVPTEAQVADIAVRVREAQQAVTQAQSAALVGAASIADLLRLALNHVTQHPHPDGACPVCGTAGVIDQRWRWRTEQAIEANTRDSDALTSALLQLSEATDAARALIQPVPDSLLRAASHGIDVDAAVDAWAAWSNAPTDLEPEELVKHLEEHAALLTLGIAEVKVAAATEAQALQDAWAPLARRVIGWCATARLAETAASRVKTVRAAEAWLKNANDELRDERLRPLAEQIKAHWDELRQASNVELRDLRLTGKGNAARVDFDMQIDGTAASGLGVLSQGETNALALSVFLPRAMMQNSPFGFIVLDDPVQAMDPSKVDGLARMLARAGESRQVIVFTHDERLPEAVRRLTLPARTLRVSRRAASVVAVDPAGDPAKALLDDAAQVARNEHVPPQIAASVVPGMCRTAVETVLNDIARRRLLATGLAHSEVDDRMGDAKRLWERLSLAAKGEIVSDPEIQSWANNKLGRTAVDLLHELNRASHGKSTTGGPVTGLPNDCRHLVTQISEAIK